MVHLVTVMAICVRHPVVARRDLTLKMAQLQRWLQHTHTHTHTHTLTQTHTHTDTHRHTLTNTHIHIHTHKHAHHIGCGL